MPKTELMEFPLFQCLPVLPSSGVPHPVSIPNLHHRQNPRNLPRSFVPLKPTFFLDYALNALQAIFTPLSALATTCSSNLFHSLCLHAVPATATLHLHPLYMLLSLVPVLAIVSKHQPNCIKSQSKTLPRVHCSQVELREVLGMAHQPGLVQRVSQSLLHPRH